MKVYVWACMFHFPWQAEGFQTYTLKHTRLQTCILLIFVWWLSVYVWACMFLFPWQAEGFQTYTLKHTRLKTTIFWFFMMICLSVYVSFLMTGRGFSNIHTCSAHILIYQKHSFRACMFKRVCLVFDDRQRVFKHTYMLISLIVDSILADFAEACVYVWGLQKRWLLIAFMADFA